ncbi:hypothetical protein CRENPOLYSF2_1450005 [Crenothrix polyspora]|uniref:Uncharacterized protein n=1 Tax=Crenothrix polyspora TaxID=360316 RepID=A0A1R4H1E4_9GAMM|nr:hypothetical protein CRENPOLYSF2_1450005 [Crenothrix polyspora]
MNIHLTLEKEGFRAIYLNGFPLDTNLSFLKRGLKNYEATNRNPIYVMPTVNH